MLITLITNNYTSIDSLWVYGREGGGVDLSSSWTGVNITTLLAPLTYSNHKPRFIN